MHLSTTSSPSPQPERRGNLLRWLTLGAVGLLLFLGGIFSSRFLPHSLGGRSDIPTKLQEAFSLIQKYYVDSVNLDSITERSLSLFLAQLDPHSVYLNAEDNKASTESLEGSFAGIGIQFNTLLDTVVVVRVIEGGPSERAGLKAGDRILSADTTSLLAKDSLTSDQVMRVLKGPEKSVVRLKVQRGKEIFEARVVRGLVPVPSLDAAS